MTVKNGGTIKTNGAFIGQNTASAPTQITIAGSGSSWDAGASSYFWVFSGTTGTVIDVTSGGRLATGSAVIGAVGTGSTSVNVDGNGSVWNNTGTIYLGYNSPSMLNVTDGGTLSTPHAADFSSRNVQSGYGWSRRYTCWILHRKQRTDRCRLYRYVGPWRRHFRFWLLNEEGNRHADAEQRQHLYWTDDHQRRQAGGGRQQPSRLKPRWRCQHRRRWHAGRQRHGGHYDNCFGRHAFAGQLDRHDQRGRQCRLRLGSIYEVEVDAAGHAEPEVTSFVRPDILHGR